MKDLISKITHFFTHDLWNLGTNTAGERPGDAAMLRWLRILYVAGQGFHYDRCTLRASALTFYSLLAIVPVLALAIGIAQGFGLDLVIERELLFQFSNYQEVVAEALTFARNLLAQTRGSVIAGLGIIILIWTVVNILSQIEDSFNYIWMVRQARSWKRKFSDYLSASWICPFLMIISSSTLVVMVTEIESITEKIPYIGTYSRFIKLLFDLIPLVATWALMTFLYVFMPNTKVRLKSAFVAGFACAIIYHLFHIIYVWFQFRISSYGAVYGSFVAFPLFLIWLQISWMIILFGAELTYAHQFRGLIALKKDAQARMAFQDRELYALNIMHRSITLFSEGKPAPTAEELADHSRIPLHATKLVLDDLVETSLLSSSLRKQEEVYQPAKDISNLRIADVSLALSRCGYSFPMAQWCGEKHILQKFNELQSSMTESSANKLIKDI